MYSLAQLSPACIANTNYYIEENITKLLLIHNTVCSTELDGFVLFIPAVFYPDSAVCSHAVTVPAQLAMLTVHIFIAT